MMELFFTHVVLHWGAAPAERTKLAPERGSTHRFAPFQDRKSPSASIAIEAKFRYLDIKETAADLARPAIPALGRPIRLRGEGTPE